MNLTSGAKKKPLSEQAYRKIEESILTARFAPGSWVTEPAIVAGLGIGRTPVREAVQRLARNGLVEIVPGRGIRVTDVNANDQIQILELRRSIEDLLVRRSIRHGTAQEKAEMRRLGARFKNPSRITDPMRFREFDSEFKRLLLVCAKHRYAEGAIFPLWSANARFLWVHRTLENKAVFAELVGQLIEAIVSESETEALRANAARMDHLDEFVRATLDT